MQFWRVEDYRKNLLRNLLERDGRLAADVQRADLNGRQARIIGEWGSPDLPERLSDSHQFDYLVSDNPYLSISFPTSLVATDWCAMTEDEGEKDLVVLFVYLSCQKHSKGRRYQRATDWGCDSGEPERGRGGEFRNFHLGFSISSVLEPEALEILQHIDATVVLLRDHLIDQFAAQTIANMTGWLDYVKETHVNNHYCIDGKTDDWIECSRCLKWRAIRLGEINFARFVEDCADQWQCSYNLDFAKGLAGCSDSEDSFHGDEEAQNEEQGFRRMRKINAKYERFLVPDKEIDQDNPPQGRFKYRDEGTDLLCDYARWFARYDVLNRKLHDWQRSYPHYCLLWGHEKLTATPGRFTVDGREYCEPHICADGHPIDHLDPPLQNIVWPNLQNSKPPEPIRWCKDPDRRLFCVPMDAQMTIIKTEFEELQKMFSVWPDVIEERPKPIPDYHTSQAWKICALQWLLPGGGRLMRMEQWLRMKLQAEPRLRTAGTGFILDRVLQALKWEIVICGLMSETAERRLFPELDLNCYSSLCRRLFADPKLKGKGQNSGDWNRFSDTAVGLYCEAGEHITISYGSTPMAAIWTKINIMEVILTRELGRAEANLNICRGDLINNEAVKLEE